MRPTLLRIILCLFLLCSTYIEAKAVKTDLFHNESVKLVGLELKPGEATGWINLDSEAVLFFSEEALIRVKYEKSPAEVKVLKKNQTLIPKCLSFNIQNIGSAETTFLIIENKK